MISVERLPLLIETLLLVPLKLHCFGFLPSYSTNIDSFLPFESVFNPVKLSDDTTGRCIWWHEEPINEIDFNNLHYKFPINYTGQAPMASGPGSIFLVNHDVHFHILANSEKSKLKKNLFATKNSNFLDEIKSTKNKIEREIINEIEMKPKQKIENDKDSLLRAMLENMSFRGNQ